MIQFNTSDILLCQKSLKDIQASLDIAIESRNAEALYDTLLTLPGHFELCAQKGLYGAIEEARQTVYRAINNKKNTFEIISKSGISSELIGLLGETIGFNLTRTILRAESSYYQDYATTMADETALFKAKFKETMLSAKADYSMIYLTPYAKQGNYQCLIEAIESLSLFEQGAMHLTQADFWKALSSFKPARNTKQNYLKLPDALKKVIRKHHAMITESYNEYRAGQNSGCSTSVIRELFEFDLKDLALLMLRDALKIQKDHAMPDGISLKIPRSYGRSYRLISLMSKMGFGHTADRFLEFHSNRKTHGDYENVHHLMCALAYMIECPFYDSKKGSQIMNETFSMLEKDYPEISTPALATLLFELRRNLNPKDELIQDKLSCLANHIGYLAGKLHHGHHHIKSHMSDWNADDIIDEIVKSSGFKRANLTSDLGM